MRRIFADQTGDTIVEVLIAIAVISSVLGITYGIMNKNLSVIRNNQERTEATKIAQSQVEALKIQINQTPNNILSRGDNLFCINIGSNTIQALTGTPPTDYATENYTIYANCTDTLFSYFIGRDTTDSTDKSYNISVRWPAFNGGRSQVILKYRIP